MSTVSSPATDSTQNPGNAQLAGELTSVQQAALRELGNGQTITDAARTAGVDRRTVSRWIHHDPKFAAAYNAWCRELLDSGRARALAMSDAALATVANAIQNGHVGAALQVVRNLGLIAAPQIGPTDPDQLQRRSALRQVRREERLRKAEKQYGLHKPIEQVQTIEEIDQILAPWIELRDDLVGIAESRWQEYGEDLRCGRDCTPPDRPRPTLEEYADAVHRLSKKYNWNAESFIEGSRKRRAQTQEILRQRAQPAPPSTTPPASAAASSPSSPPDSPPSPPAAPNPSPSGDASAIVKTHATRPDPAPPQPARKVPRPYVEPEEDGPWVRYS